MAVTRADKEQELQELAAAFKAADTAILVDYKGLNVPAVTELRRQIRGAKAQYKVVKNTLAKRASKGTKLAALEAHFEGTTAVAYTGEEASGGHRPRDAAGQARALFEVAVRVAGTDAAAGDRVVRNAAQPGDGA